MVVVGAAFVDEYVLLTLEVLDVTEEETLKVVLELESVTVVLVCEMLELVSVSVAEVDPVVEDDDVLLTVALVAVRVLVLDVIALSVVEAVSV